MLDEDAPPWVRRHERRRSGLDSTRLVPCPPLLRPLAAEAYEAARAIWCQDDTLPPAGSRGLLGPFPPRR